MFRELQERVSVIKRRWWGGALKRVDFRHLPSGALKLDNQESTKSELCCFHFSHTSSCSHSESGQRKAQPNAGDRACAKWGRKQTMPPCSLLTCFSYKKGEDTRHPDNSFQKYYPLKLCHLLIKHSLSRTLPGDAWWATPINFIFYYDSCDLVSIQDVGIWRHTHISRCWDPC